MSMFKQTVQAAMLAAISNLLAQTLSAYQENRPFRLDPVPLFQFVLFTMLSVPPNVVWQQFLEDSFPGYVKSAPVSKTAKEKKPDPEKLSIPNTLAKFFIDMTVGALVNTILFLALMGTIQGASNDEIFNRVRLRTIPMILDGYKFWPAISLANFALVPVEKRIVVGSVAGILWGIYLSMSA